MKSIIPNKQPKKKRKATNAQSKALQTAIKLDVSIMNIYAIQISMECKGERDRKKVLEMLYLSPARRSLIRAYK